MGVLQRLYSRLMTGILWVTCALVVVLTTTVFLNVLIRYAGILQGKIAWADELSRYMSIWLVFLGSVVALDKGQHVSADFLSGLLPARLRPWLSLLVQASMAVLLCILIRQGLVVVQRTTQQFSPALHLAMANVYLAIPTGSLLMLIVCLRRVVVAIQEMRTPGAARATQGGPAESLPAA